MKKKVLIFGFIFATFMISGCSFLTGGGDQERPEEEKLSEFQGIGVLNFEAKTGFEGSRTTPSSEIFLALSVRNNALGDKARNLTVSIQNLDNVIDCEGDLWDPSTARTEWKNGASFEEKRSELKSGGEFTQEETHTGEYSYLAEERWEGVKYPSELLPGFRVGEEYIFSIWVKNNGENDNEVKLFTNASDASWHNNKYGHARTVCNVRAGSGWKNCQLRLNLANEPPHGMHYRFEITSEVKKGGRVELGESKAVYFDDAYIGKEVPGCTGSNFYTLNPFLKVNQQGVKKIRPDEEIQFLFLTKMPSKEELRGISQGREIYYTVSYVYSKHMSYSFPALSSSELVERRQQKEELELSSEYSSTAGAIEIEPQLPSPLTYNMEGESPRYDLVLNVKNKGDGYPVSGKNVTLSLTFDNTKLVPAVPQNKIENEYNWEKVDAGSYLLEMSPSDVILENSFRFPFEINNSHLKVLQDQRVPMTSFSFKFDLNYTYMKEGSTKIKVIPIE